MANLILRGWLDAVQHNEGVSKGGFRNGNLTMGGDRYSSCKAKIRAEVNEDGDIDMLTTVITIPVDEKSHYDTLRGKEVEIDCRAVQGGQFAGSYRLSALKNSVRVVNGSAGSKADKKQLQPA